MPRSELYEGHFSLKKLLELLFYELIQPGGQPAAAMLPRFPAGICKKVINTA
jgi:hypothetical protein